MITISIILFTTYVSAIIYSITQLTSLLLELYSLVSSYRLYTFYTL